MDYKKEIAELKKEKNAVILAHYYQEDDIQEIADFVGDSLELSRKAAGTDANIIVFAGVYFMGECAKILNPDKKVLVPDKDAGCSLEMSCQPNDFEAFIKRHPNAVKVTYINCSAEIKSMSDIICTSSNAEKIINSIPEDKEIIFAPDYNLGRYLIKKTGRDMILWKGECVVHTAFSMGKILDLAQKHPNAKIIAHPESEEHLLDVSSFVGSTTAMINHVKESTDTEFIVATEAGILHKMRQLSPDKKIIPAPSVEDNTCACSECGYMKMNSMEKLYLCLRDEKPEVWLPESLRIKALAPIEKMLSIS